MTPSNQAYFYGIAAVLLWSTVASAFKISLRYLEPSLLLLFSCLVSCVVLGVVLTARGQLGAVLELPRSEYLRSATLGAVNPLLYYLVLFEAYRRLPAQEAGPLNYTWALVLAYLSVPLLRQRLLLTDIVAGIVCYSGVLVVATGGNPWALEFSDCIGVVLALSSTVLWAFYWIYNTRDSVEPVIRLFLNFLFALPLALIAALLLTDNWHPSIPGLLGAAYVGVFEMGFTFVLWLSALRRAVNTSRVGNLIFLSPPLSLAFIHHFVGEKILTGTVAGLTLILAGLILQRAGAARKQLVSS
ncbi:MAG: DMT family transporter [Candidatus Latescibacterota bacterium]|nr:DMT family transporter [Candidatus Latescibacterota bacterium]